MPLTCRHARSLAVCNLAASFLACQPSLSAACLLQSVADKCTWPAQIQGLPTLVFIGMDKEKPALRLEGLLPASAIKDVLADLTSGKIPT